MSDLTPVSNTTATALVDGITVGATRLVGFKAVNAGGAAFVQLFDSKVSVATGTVPLMSWPIGASLAVSISWPAGYPRSMASGVRIELSSLASVYASMPAQMLIDIQSA